MYGGLACSDWSYKGTKSIVAPPLPGYAFRADKIEQAITVQDLELVARDGADPGSSSIAAYVNGSLGVAFARVRLVAGKGAKGSDGPVAPNNHLKPEDLNGSHASSANAGSGKICKCLLSGESHAGGGNGAANQTGFGGGAEPRAYEGDTGYGASANCVGPAQSGGRGKPTEPSAPAATSPGTLDSDTWRPSAGSDGPDGNPAQGGGGGATGTLNLGRGGAGACGGCGGGGGPGGSGGGATVGLLVTSATVSFVASGDRPRQRWSWRQGRGGTSGPERRCCRNRRRRRLQRSAGRHRAPPEAAAPAVRRDLGRLLREGHPGPVRTKRT